MSWFGSLEWIPGEKIQNQTQEYTMLGVVCGGIGAWLGLQCVWRELPSDCSTHAQSTHRACCVVHGHDLQSSWGFSGVFLAIHVIEHGSSGWDAMWWLAIGMCRMVHRKEVAVDHDGPMLVLSNLRLLFQCSLKPWTLIEVLFNIEAIKKKGRWASTKCEDLEDFRRYGNARESL